MRSARFTLALLAALIAACGGATPAPLATTAPATEGPATEAPATPHAEPQGTPPGGTPPGFPTVVYEQVVSDPQVVALLAGLQQRGFAPELMDASRVDLLAAAPGQGYRLGDGWLMVHLYPTAQAAEAQAAALPYDARLNVDWVAPPHFFRCDRLILLYMGSDARVIGALSELCAPPFYSSNFSLPAPAATP